MRGSVICGPQWLATPAVLVDVQMQGAMHESGVPPGLGQTTPPKCGPHQTLPVGLRDQCTGRLDSQAGTAVSEGSGCRAVNPSTDGERQWKAD